MTEDEEVERAFRDGFIGDLSEGQFLMHFNRDSSGRVTSSTWPRTWSGPMRFIKVANNAQEP
jgi:hypothetical protein